MYPGHTGTSTHSATGTTRNTTVATATRRPPVQKMAPTILPQPVLLVGYTPDGSPILMSNPNQGSVSSLMSTSSAASTSTGRQIHTLNSSLYSTSVSTSGAPYAGPSGPMTNNDYLSTIFQDKQPVMAVATTVLGPDGKSCVALVKPTSHSEIGSQVIERGLISTGGTYQLVKEPNGRIVRHVFHDQVHAMTSTGEKAMILPGPMMTTTNSSVAPPTPSYVYTTPHAATSAHSATSGQLQTQNISSQNFSSPSQAPPRDLSSTSSYTSSTSVASSSPPHPTVQSTADFLRENSSLRLSYCPPASADSPESKLVNYVTWDSDIVKGSPPSHVAKPDPIPEIRKTPAVAPNPSLVEYKPPTSNGDTSHSTSSSNQVKNVEQQPSHTPSKALKYHLTHGGDKGLVDVANPYDDL